MKSLQLTIGFISFMMLLSKSQLSSSSPAGIRPDGRKFFSEEDPIIDENTLENEGNELHPRIASSNVHGKANHSDNTVLEKIENNTKGDKLESEGRKFHPRMKHIHRSLNASNSKKNSDNEDPIIDDDLIATESVTLHPRMKQKKLNEKNNISKKPVERSGLNVSEAKSADNSKLHPRMKHINTTMKDNISAASGEIDQVDSINNVSASDFKNVKPMPEMNKKASFNPDNMSVDEGQKDLFFKHDHLTSLLFDSTQLDDISTQHSDLEREGQKENNSMTDAAPLGRANFNEASSSHNEFQARSDANLNDRSTEEASNSSSEQVDRSFEIDAAGMIEDSVSLDNENIEVESESDSTKKNEDNGGLLNFLRSLFGL